MAENSIAFAFPGQGSQKVGMLADAHARFDDATDVDEREWEGQKRRHDRHVGVGPREVGEAADGHDRREAPLQGPLETLHRPHHIISTGMRET